MCEIGYKGILCEECDYIKGYSKSLINKCEKCPSYNTIIIMAVLISIAYIILIKMTSSKVK